MDASVGAGGVGRHDAGCAATQLHRDLRRPNVVEAARGRGGNLLVDHDGQPVVPDLRVDVGLDGALAAVELAAEAQTLVEDLALRRHVDRCRVNAGAEGRHCRRLGGDDLRTHLSRSGEGGSGRDAGVRARGAAGGREAIGRLTLLLERDAERVALGVHRTLFPVLAQRLRVDAGTGGVGAVATVDAAERGLEGGGRATRGGEESESERERGIADEHHGLEALPGRFIIGLELVVGAPR